MRRLPAQAIGARAMVFFGILQFREKEPNQPQPKCFTDGVIAVRGNGVIDIFVNPLGMSRDHDGKLRDPLEAWQMENWRTQ